MAEGKSGQEVDGNDRDPDPLREPAEQTSTKRMAPSSMSRMATCAPEVSAAAATSIWNQPLGVLSAESAVPSRMCAT